MCYIANNFFWQVIIITAGEKLQIAMCVLISYSSFFSALLLAGRDRIKSAYFAVIPTFFAVLGFVLPWHILGYMCILLSAAAVFGVMLYLSKKNICVSSVVVLIAFSFCLAGQIILRSPFSDTLRIVISACVGVILPTVIFISKIVIFPENYILSKEQKKKMIGRRFYLFVGITVCLVWQIMLLYGVCELTLPIFIFTLILHFAALILLRQQVNGMLEKIENIIDKQYQSELLSFMRVIRSQRHDFNFHTQTIYGMIENGQFDECKAYVKSMMETVKSTNDLLPLFHPATSALLNTFKEMAIQKGLSMDIEIHDNLQFISSSVFETNTIIGNLLQNAIDELELHTENKNRNIKVLIIKRGSNNIIKISNQCHLPPEEMSRIFMPGFTTKNSHEGLGLANALHVAEKYDGTVYPEFDGDIVHFIAKIPLKK